MITWTRFALILAVSGSVVFGQQPGAGSRGGSLRLEKPEAGHRANLKTLAAFYRPVVRILAEKFSVDLNFTELIDEYEATRKDNPRLKFETVITAYIAAEHSSSFEIDGKAVVHALKSAGNNLALALQRVSSLTGKQAKSQAQQATEIYKQAERLSRQR